MLSAGRRPTVARCGAPCSKGADRMKPPPQNLFSKLASAGEHASSAARESVDEAQLKHDLAQAYGELGRTAFVLVELGTLHEQSLVSSSRRIREIERRLTALERRR